MRRGVLVVALAAAACGSNHYGTYFVADGRHAGITFDHVEFFFGSSIDGGFASPHLGAQAGTVYRRTANDSDIAVPAAHGGRQATYYLPPNKLNNDLGDYVLAVAYDANNTPVGVGDVADFPTPLTDAVTEIPIELAPPAGLELWGTRPGCAAWQRSADDLVAVVHADDRDCDSAPVSTDCNDLSYCTPGDPICTASPRLCADASCTLGCPTSAAPGGTCAPTVCMFAAACGQDCMAATTLAAKLSCLATIATVTHADFQVPVVQTQPDPCVDQFDIKLPNGLECTNPKIEFEETLPDGYTFSVDGGGSTCTIRLIASPTNQRFQGDHHLLVSFEAPDPASPRYSMFFGVMPLPVMQCTNTVQPSSNPLTVNMCQ